MRVGAVTRAQDEQISDFALVRPDAGRIDEEHFAECMARRRGYFGGQPAAQCTADDANALQPLRFQKPGIEADEIEDRVEPGGTPRAVEARMRRQIHGKMVSQGLRIVAPAQTPLGAVEDQQGRPGSALEESDLRPAYVDECFMYACRHGVFLLGILVVRPKGFAGTDR
jgi:hypothetical protein